MNNSINFTNEELKVILDLIQSLNFTLKDWNKIQIFSQINEKIERELNKNTPKNSFYDDKK